MTIRYHQMQQFMFLTPNELYKTRNALKAEIEAMEKLCDEYAEGSRISEDWTKTDSLIDDIQVKCDEYALLEAAWYGSTRDINDMLELTLQHGPEWFCKGMEYEHEMYEAEEEPDLEYFTRKMILLVAGEVIAQNNIDLKG